MDTRTQVKQIVDIAWRRRLWLIVPAALGLIGSAYVASTLPKVYRATTTILVSRQSVPEDIVRSTVTTRIDERMKSLKIQVLSRRYLEQVAREIGAVREGATDAELERASKKILDSVSIEIDTKGLSYFRIAVEDENPKHAAQVANRLAELFMDQNTQLRQNQAKGTVDTIQAWLQTTESELRQRDKKIADYKALHLYELPDQEGSALQLMSAAQNRVMQLSSDIQSRADRLMIFRGEEKSRRAAAGSLGGSPVSDDPDARALAQLERELQDLLTNYTEENPLVRRKREQIAQFNRLHPSVENARAGNGEATPGASAEVQHLEADIRNLEADRAREQRNIDDLRHRISNMPLRQQELAELTRDYDSLKNEYTATVAQRQDAQRSQDLENANKGEQFQIQDRARPPAVPFKPQILQIILMGLLGGLGVGVGLTALFEFIDQSVRGEEEFAQLFPDVVVLGSIPNLDADTTAPKPLLGRISKERAV